MGRAGAGRSLAGGKATRLQPASVRAHAWLVLGMSPSLTFSDWMDVWHSVAEPGEMIFVNGEVVNGYWREMAWVCHSVRPADTKGRCVLTQHT